MLRLAQAASSEYFSEWGTPPNQRRTGATPDNPGGNMDGELNIVPFYGGWEYCFRAKDSAVAEKIAWNMEGAVWNGKYFGYGQGSLASDGGKYPRTTAFDAILKEKTHNPRKVKTLCNCDCSSSAGFSVFFAGVEDDRLRDMWSGNEREILMSTGAFVEITDPLLLELGTGLRRGDIMLKSGHTAIAIDDDDHHDTYPIMIKGCYQSQIRTGPGIEYKSIGIVDACTILNATGTATDSDGTIWYRVIYGDTMGYTSSLYAVKLPTGYCTGDVWLRKTAGTSGKKVIVIPKGATVYLTGKATNAWSGVVRRVWLECVYGGHKGWASSLYVKS